MTSGLKIRKGTRQDTPQILEVLKLALGESPLLKRTPELLGWKHWDNPFGESILLVAEIDGQIAGVRALMRWELMTPSGERVKCVRPVDTATHPDYLRRGVFKSLTLAALDAAREDGVQLVFNTPNQKSAPGYLKMGWKEVGWTGAMIRPRLGTSVQVSEGRPPRIEDWVPGAIAHREHEMIDRPPLGLRTPRDASYLSWRFSSHPTASYGWVPGIDDGGVVLRASNRGGRSETVVADIIGGASGRDVGAAARMSRSRYLATWFSTGSPERRKAMSAGLLPVPTVKTLRLVAKPLTHFDLDIFDLGSWDLAVSDMELL